MPALSVISSAIKEKAFELGFDACGMAPATLSDHSEYLKEWLQKDYQAGMGYMKNHLEKRVDPRLLVEGVRSVISVALNYYPGQKLSEQEYQLAWYAYGKDYHDVMRDKLAQLYNYIVKEFAPVTGRFFCDTAPVLERYWAWRAGVGFIGRNTQLIIPGKGSCFFLGELILDLEMEYDTPLTNHCGSCTRCIDRCPGKALEKPYLLNAGKCLSYLTIEHRGALPEGMDARIGSRIYGCDECQQVCPWNRKAVATTVPDFTLSADLLAMGKESWHSLTPEKYRSLFKGSAVKRAKFDGLTRNIEAVRRSRCVDED